MVFRTYVVEPKHHFQLNRVLHLQVFLHHSFHYMPDT